MSDKCYTDPQPPPQPNDRPKSWEMVIADMQQRDRDGTAKYGTPLQPFNGRDSLVDAYQESLDLAVYLRTAIEENHFAAPDTELRRLARAVVDAHRDFAGQDAYRDRVDPRIDALGAHLEAGKAQAWVGVDPVEPGTDRTVEAVVPVPATPAEPRRCGGKPREPWCGKWATSPHPVAGSTWHASGPCEPCPGCHDCAPAYSREAFERDGLVGRAPAAPVEGNERERAREIVEPTDTRAEYPFEKWWRLAGRTLDPDTSDVPWFDKREELCRYAWDACLVWLRAAPVEQHDLEGVAREIERDLRGQFGAFNEGLRHAARIVRAHRGGRVVADGTVQFFGSPGRATIQLRTATGETTHMAVPRDGLEVGMRLGLVVLP